MTNSIDKLKSEFIKAKKSGWIEVEKGNYGVIGTTFEKIVGVTPNDFQIPDFENIELKTKSGTKFKSISLFNCVPTGPHYHEVEIIKDRPFEFNRKVKKERIESGTSKDFSLVKGENSEVIVIERYQWF